MILEESITAVGRSYWKPAHSTSAFRAPLYGSYCFSRIPGTIERLFGIDGGPALPAGVLPGMDRYKKVILLCIDGFGWRFFRRFVEEIPQLRRFEREGIVSLLTSQFPSTTACHMTTLHTGLSSLETGVFEWSYYDPDLDLMLLPLKFSESGSVGRDALERRGISPRSVFPWPTLYERLLAAGVPSTVYQYAGYTPSSFSNAMFAGADVKPFRTTESGMANLFADAAAENGTRYFYLYVDTFDGVAHVHGPRGKEVASEASKILCAVEAALDGAGPYGDTLLLITADHGVAECDPRTTLYLDLEVPGIVNDLRVNGSGRPLVPGGSPRDMFLYVRSEAIERVKDMLGKLLDGVADVCETKELLAASIFGEDEPSERFLRRMSELVVLPQLGESVWWSGRGVFNNRFYGHHGGLTPEEMEIPFVALPLSTW